MRSHTKNILAAGLMSVALALPFATDAQAYGYHGYGGGVVIGGPYYPYAYPAYPAYYAPPPYAPPPYPYAPYAYAPPPVVAAPVVAPAIGFGVHIR